MSQGRKTPTGLVADADVLIDYAKSDKSVLALLSRHVATVHIPSPVFEEVHQLSEKDAASLDLVVVEPMLSQALEAKAGEGPTSFQDRLCFVMARDEGWAVLTNDKALRRACDNEGISCMWGLKAMGLLVEKGHLHTPKAMSIAEKIARINPFITDNILEKFRKEIGL